MPDLKPVSMRELVDELNRRLHASSEADCSCCRYTRLQRVQAAGEKVANWDTGIIPLACEGKPDDACLKLAREIARLAKNEFSLSEE